MINNDWKTRHVRVPSFFEDDGWERGGITLRYKVSEEGIEYKYSICNPKDQYSRKLGIAWAELSQPSVAGVYVDGSETSFNVEAAILMDIVEKGRDSLSKYTLDLVHIFVLTGTKRLLREFFYPKKVKSND